MKIKADMKLQTSLTFLGCILLLVFSCATASCPQGCSLCEGGRLRCPGVGLTSLPSPIPADTYTMDLTQNNIETLDGLPDLPDVQSFRMSLNRLQVIKDGDFEKTPLLQSLDLSMNEITEVYNHGFRGLHNLQSLSLNGNKLQEIGIIFANTPMISSLRLGNNVIEKIEEENFQNNKMIKMLDLSHNRILSIHGNAFKNLNMLRYLILSNNPITTLSDLTFSSTMLALTDISNCELESVPRTMPPSLVDFRLGNNKITRIEVDDFTNITSLNLLTLNDNKINHVEHRSFGNLMNLKELWLSRNDLVYIPRGLPKGLVKLFIDNNKVVELEPMLFKEDSELTVLSLEANNVRKVHTESLKNIQKLEKLSLQANEIPSIEAGTFTNLPNLQVLTLAENPIQVFEAEAFGNLPSLTEISLAYIDGKEDILEENFLVYMPNLTSIDLMSSIHLSQAFLDEFDETSENQLHNVIKVNLQYNELTTLSEGVKDFFPNIRQLLLDGNLLQCDRRLLWLRAWMRTTTIVSFHQYEPPTCQTPKSLKGRLISELPLDQFVDIPETADEPTNTENNGNELQASAQASENSPTSQQNHNDHLQTIHNNNDVQQPSYSHQAVIAGTRVIIKPPSSSRANPILPNNGNRDEDKEKDTVNNDDKDREMTKAERKAARLAERERRKRLREERRKQKRNKRKKDNAEGKRRKKRKIRNKNGKNCRVDKDGNTKCRRRKRCKVDADGNVKCRKRKNKEDSAKSKNVA